jgi:hypothetical protein
LLDERGQIEAAESFLAYNDTESTATAADLFGSVSDVVHGCEVWQGARRVAVVDPGVRQPTDLERWNAARQARFMALEERLAASSECIGTSRQLMETVDKLLGSKSRPAGLAGSGTD